MSDIEQAACVVDKEVVESPKFLGKECQICYRILAYSFFKRDSSYRDGRRDVCDVCESAPRLSIAEHTTRIREGNYNSEAVRAQRWPHQEDFEDDEARIGRGMDSSDFIRILKHLVPSLYFTDGAVIGDIAVYQINETPRADWDGKSFRYLWYIPQGFLPEFSLYEFDSRDVPIREKQRGWRTPLLRLIEAKLLSEELCDQVFGRPSGRASNVWHRSLKAFRNRF